MRATRTLFFYIVLFLEISGVEYFSVFRMVFTISFKSSFAFVHNIADRIFVPLFWFLFNHLLLCFFILFPSVTIPPYSCLLGVCFQSSVSWSSVYGKRDNIMVSLVSRFAFLQRAKASTSSWLCSCWVFPLRPCELRDMYSFPNSKFKKKVAIVWCNS